MNSSAEMADILNNSQQLGTEKYPKESEKWIQYGTSGFRTKYDTYYVTSFKWVDHPDSHIPYGYLYC